MWGVRSLFYGGGDDPHGEDVVRQSEQLSDCCELGGDTGCGRGQNSSLDGFICPALHFRDTLREQNTPIVSAKHVNIEL